jgi:hypothetical protein
MNSVKNLNQSESSKVSPMGGDLEGAGAVTIRRAEKKDCKRLLELIHQLAVYEKAPDAVTATLEHFVESGFGENPVWYGFVAEVDAVVQGFALYYISCRSTHCKYLTRNGNKCLVGRIVTP